MFSHMNVMADIVSTMIEHATWDGIEQKAASAAAFLLTNSEKFSNLSLFDKFCYYFSIFCFFLFFVLVCRISYACGLHILIYKLLCKPIKTPTSTSQRPTEIQMVSLAHPANQQQIA